MAVQQRTYTRYTLDSISVLGKLIREGRKTRRMTETELAERLGIARSTVQRVEKGDPKVEIGIMFEAAALVGVPLFDANQREVQAHSARLDDRLAVLPKHVRKVTAKIIDDF
ncbi:MAG: helix-turn-helix transcriptional regulator [Idiomarina sp.]|nr:helix-turn-helix transcriptional regulator [Idiomarina sp.]